MNEKYIAGLLDADGSIQLHFNKREDGTYRAAASVKICLVGDLKYLAEEFNLNWRQQAREQYKDTDEIYAYGDRAVTFLNRVKKHLRIKNHLAEWVLTNHGIVVDNPKSLKKEMQEVRKVTASMDNRRHPSRAWLAGYFDGDGCIAFFNRRSECWLQITAWGPDKPILDTLSNHLGGKVYRHTGDSFQWKKYLRRNGSEVIDYFKKHVVVRRHQLDKYLQMTHND